jgi:undecaprenyl-diphosphatase
MTEIQIVSYLNHLGAGTILDTITIVFSNIPFLIVLWSVLAFTAFYHDKKHGRKVFLAILVAVLMYFMVNDVIFKSYLIEFFGIKLRPYLAYPSDIIALGPRLVDSSFPSGHVASSVSVLVVISHFYKKWWIPSIIFILFMIFCRMHMGMHYPVDVLAGALFGVFYALLGIKFSKMILSRRK